MGHNPGTQKATKAVVEKRTPEEIMKVIRGNIATNLFVTPTDQRFLLVQYDSIVRNRTELLESTDKNLQQTRAERDDLGRQVADLQARLLETENIRMTVDIKRIAEDLQSPTPSGDPYIVPLGEDHDDGGEA